ncbi:hypothetical protein TRFO_30423 [Tritrichomonas foetus]|uniref:Uncharacterized protein n=1 Tax=Tritrichomonas foetus TaxID=1144522 RepID=A0A1J4JUT6_9EUKA|nr:hypothetical protein TRFO_30423 [Tritrichomonas foetus]|eukprot:OHT02474.1 hypothetical protein TRFO_30423 [Tritrichomonas foetus]
MYVNQMDELPFARRPLRRPIDTTQRERGVFDPSFHRPQNEQQGTPRKAQMGAYNPKEIQIKVRTIDGRRDISDRDRENIFFDSTKATSNLPAVKSPVGLERNTRHMHTPYSYQTKWISHAQKNTSLAPKEDNLWETSFLKTPAQDEDRIRKEREHSSRIATIHYFDKKVSDYYQQRDKQIQIADARHLHNYVHQRACYSDALEKRRRIEKIKYFE